MHARLKGLRIVADRLGEGVKIEDHALDPKIAEAAYETWGWRPDKSEKTKKQK